jgi:hypothetical protein
MTKPLVTILFLLVNVALYGQSMIKFAFSDCLKDCKGDSSVIKEMSEKRWVTTIKLKTYAPCNGNLAGGVEITADVLNLKFWTKSTVVTDKKGAKLEILEVADCDCMFDFQYQIRNAPRIEIKNVRVNGRTLREIDALSIIKVETILLRDN